MPIAHKLQFARALLLLIVAGCAATPPDTPLPSVPTAVKMVPPKVALVLGGGGARGFAHIGVIKVLEAKGIVPDIIVGTSVGSLVGALYAAGYGAADLERAALGIEESMIGDWAFPDRGLLKGEALQNFVNSAVQQRPLEKLNRTLAVVVTDLNSGEQIVLRSGNTGAAVRASSSVPGLFQPVTINGHDYVDGGLVSPVPVRVAKTLGADVVIAVDVSNKPRYGKVVDTVDVLLQAFAIMGQAIASNELPEADVVIRPDTSRVGRAEFANRKLAIRAGEQAALATLARLQDKIAAKAGIAAR